MSARAPSPARDGEAGISLVEVLVVLAIVGLMSGLSVIGLGALDRGSRAEAEARRLADRLRLASDEVLVTAMPVAMIWDARGYRFVGWDPAAEAWEAHSLPELGTPHILSAALRLEAEEGAAETAVLITPDLPQPPVVLRLSGGGGPWRVSFDGFAAAAAPVEP